MELDEVDVSKEKEYGRYRLQMKKYTLLQILSKTTMITMSTVTPIQFSILHVKIKLL